MYFISKGEIHVLLKIEREGVIKEEIYKILREGQFFGEVALLTKLKRSATLKAADYSNCAYLTKKDIKKLEQNFPHIVQQFRDKIKDYSDPKMHFRRLMIRNLHYLRTVDDEIINEIICCLQVQRFAKGSNILKSGDVTDVISQMLIRIENSFLKRGNY